MAPLLAHQGGWDEILLFVAPIVLAFFVIRGLERRGKAARERRDQEDSGSQNTVP
jgi:hypothetical protein